MTCTYAIWVGWTCVPSRDSPAEGVCGGILGLQKLPGKNPFRLSLDCVLYLVKTNCDDETSDRFAWPLQGLALFLLLSFRTNSSYERWWEGRKLWEGMTAKIQDIARIAFGTILHLGASHRQPMLLSNSSSSFLVVVGR